jgi:hypothetical protein
MVKKLLLTLIVVLLGYNVNAQLGICDVKVNYLAYTNEYPGIEATMNVENVGSLPVFTAQIFWATDEVPGFNLIPLSSVEWGGYLQPGESRDILIPECFDLPYGEHEIVFEVIALDNGNTQADWAYCGQGDANQSNNTIVATILQISEVPCANSNGDAYCDECGVASSIEEHVGNEQIVGAKYFTLNGQQISPDRLQPNVLYIVRETTKSSTRVYKTVVE